MNLLSKRAPLILMLAIIIAMGASLGYQGYLFSNELKQETPKSSQQSTPIKITNRDVKLPPNTRKLFGDASAPKEQKVVAQKELPKTNLKLTLRGVSAKLKEGEGAALIEGPNKETLQYNIGDALPGNAKLHSVYSDRIVLTRAGSQENLFFPKQTTGGGIEYYPEEEPEPASYTKAASTLPSSPKKVPSRSISEERKEEIRRKLEELRQRMKVK